MNLEKIKNYTINHKKTTALIIIALALVIYGTTKAFSGNSSQTTYLVGAVEKSTIITSVSGTGQVSALNQVDLKSKVSGDVVYVGVTNGQRVQAGTLIAQIDARDAEISLENAKISYEKLTAIDPLNVTKAENALTDAKDSNKKAIEDGFTAVADTFIDLPDTISGLNDMLNNYQTGYLNSNKVRPYGPTAMNYLDKASASYASAQEAYDTTFAKYKNISRSSPTSSIEGIISDSYNTTKAISQAVKSTKDLFDYIKDQDPTKQTGSTATTAQSDLTSWTEKTNSSLASLQSAKNSLISSVNSVTEKQNDLNDLKTGADPLDIRSQELTLEQKRTAYQDYFIRAAFDGTVANMDLKKGNSLSNGNSFGSLITSQKIAEITLNEVDVAKVKVGQKATLTFDAIPDLTITGKVIDVDLIGTASQGVVSYDVKIGFDLEDDQVKSGMSVSASIVTDLKQDVLTVPSAAIKIQNGTSYVQVVDNSIATTTGNTGTTLVSAPEQREVVTGISDDTVTEIISGLQEGDKIITRTINSTATVTKPTAASATSLLGGNRAGARASQGNRGG